MDRKRKRFRKPATFSCCKSYAKQIIKTIRKKDTKAIIVVGTPTWSQLGSDGTHNEVADSPIKDYKNIMYSLHFYANEWSHNEHVGCEWQWSDQYDKYREMAEKAGSDKCELFLLEFDKQKRVQCLIGSGKQ